MFSQKEIISKLARIKELTFERFDSNGILTHSLSGIVRTEITSDKEIILNEFINWSNPDSLLINSKNIYCWTTTDSGNITLSHLRFGKNNPVFLVELYQAQENFFKSIKPHNCNNDLYSATMTIKNDQIKLSWNIEGPTENYSLAIVYS